MQLRLKGRCSRAGGGNSSCVMALKQEVMYPNKTQLVVLSLESKDQQKQAAQLAVGFNLGAFGKIMMYKILVYLM